MKIFIGIDGGGTKTECLVTEENFKTLYTSVHKPTNLTSLGTAAVSQIITEIVEESFSKISRDEISEVSIVAGLAGAGRIDECEKLKNHLLQSLSNRYRKKFFISIVTDAVIALEGALSGRAGAILIAGTGSILFGKDVNDNFFRVGGFGKILGDEGGGYSIGRKALQFFSHTLDGRKTKSQLDKLISDTFHISDSNTLIKKVYSGNIEIQELAPLVIKAAEENNIDAIKILEVESDELIKHIQAFLDLLKSKTMEISFIGSLISTENFYSTLLKEKIKNHFPHIKILNAEHPPEYGAILLSKKNYESGKL